MEGRTLRGAIYARVSSERQAQQRTIASQLEALKARLQADGLELAEELCFIDDGCSGSTLLRPALERLRDVAYAGGFDRLYIHSPDRLARKYAYQVLLVEELNRCGVEFVFLNHDFGANPEEDLALQMQGMIAEYERAKILERSRRGKLHAARRGSANVLSRAPYGYRYVSKHEAGGEAYYQVILEEARVVKQLFEWVGQQRLSIGEASRRLRAAGISSPSGKTYWNRTTVWGMLKNPAYKGSAAFGKTRIGRRRLELRHWRYQADSPRCPYSIYRTSPEEQIEIAVPAIVSQELFEAVAEQLAENRKRSRRQKGGRGYLLQGLLECGCCGYAYCGRRFSRASAKGKVVYGYYRCAGTIGSRFGGQPVCRNKPVNMDCLDTTVWNDVCALLRDPAAVRKEYQRRLNHQADDQTAGKQLNKQVASVRRGISRLIDAYEDGLLEKSEFEPRVRKAKERLQRLQAQAAQIAQEQAQQQDLRLAIGQLEEFSGHLTQKLDDADWTTRQEIIRTLVKTVKVQRRQVRITYRISPRPFAESPQHSQSWQHCWGRGRESVA